MTSLCNCHRCDYALRRIASDAGDVAARSRQTEPERRRANGAREFCDCDSCVNVCRNIVRHFAAGHYGGGVPRENAAALLRALVLQELLVTFSPPWDEVSP